MIDPPTLAESPLQPRVDASRIPMPYTSVESGSFLIDNQGARRFSADRPDWAVWGISLVGGVSWRGDAERRMTLPRWAEAFGRGLFPVPRLSAHGLRRPHKGSATLKASVASGDALARRQASPRAKTGQLTLPGLGFLLRCRAMGKVAGDRAGCMRQPGPRSRQENSSNQG